VGHVECTDESRGGYKVLWNEARGNWVDLSVGGNIILWILNKSAAKGWKGFVWSVIGISEGLW
jgi:hypothetical protein